MSLVLMKCHTKMQVWWSTHSVVLVLVEVVTCTLQGMGVHNVAEALLPGTWCVGGAGVGGYTCSCSQHTQTPLLVTIALCKCSS